ncbi:hypothetical protein GGS21DRAFT_522098 [Xylaria nigripes]|nr:hypothetical protein GGS21DRAFT_522098 [Xylaria nigripes]
MAPFPDFGSITFTNASAVQNSRTSDISVAPILTKSQYKEALTNCDLSVFGTVIVTSYVYDNSADKQAVLVLGLPTYSVRRNTHVTLATIPANT